MQNINIEELQEKRIAICKECPLYKETNYGAVCNSAKYLSPDGKDWSWLAKNGYVKGCGCHISTITRNPNKSCNAGKW